MAVEFNKFGKYNYNLLIGQDVPKKAQEGQKEEVKEVETKTSAFKGLEDETDLLTKNAPNLYGVNIGKFTQKDNEIADETNAILAGLGFDYKVTPRQVASVTNGLNNIVLPGLKSVEDSAVASRIADPNGPFADLFA